MSLQYLKKELRYKVDALHADKQERLLQVDTIIFVGGGWSGMPKVPRQVCDILRKKLGMKFGT